MGLRYTSRSVIRAPGSQEGRTGRINGILRRGRVATRPATAPNPARSSPLRTIRVLILLLLAVGLVLGFPTTGRAESTATVNSPDGVNLRTGPGTSYSVLTAIPFGATVTITGDAVDSDWLPVTYNGASGYVMGVYLTSAASQTASSAQQATSPLASAPPAAATPAPAAAAPAPSSTPVASPLPSPPPAGGGPASGVFATVLPPDGLNLRQGPGTTYPVLIAVPGGARVQVIGRPTTDGWYSVVYNNKLGWVDGKYLSFAAPATQPTATATPAAVAGAGTPAAPSRFIWPTESRQISTVFSASHPGIDIDEYPNGGNPVSAIAAGTVTFSGGSTCCSYGLYVIVRHADGYTSLYAHLSVVSVTEGQEVKQGTVLGKSGCSGFCTGVHVHFEIRKEGVALDPLTLLAGPYVIE
jgi:murein DD-endopeptidase MepM/ murein hydrolase activator NlpD